MATGIDTEATLAALDQTEKEAEEKAQEGPREIITKMENCPHCGYDPNEDKIHITEEDRKEFYRCLIGMRAFTKKFELFGGDLVLTMTALNGPNVDAVNRKLRPLQFGDNTSEILELSLKLKILFACKSIKTPEKEIEVQIPENLDKIDIHEEFRKQFDIPETHIRILSKTYTEFDMLIDSLSKEGFDENFYKGGGAV